MSDPRPGRPRRFAAIPGCWVHLARRVITRHVVGTAPEGIIDGRIYRRTGTRESEERLRSGDRHQYRRSRARLRRRRLRRRGRPRHHDPHLARLPPGTGHRPGGDQRHERPAQPGRRRRQARLEPGLVAGDDVGGRPRRARDLVVRAGSRESGVGSIPSPLGRAEKRRRLPSPRSEGPGTCGAGGVGDEGSSPHHLSPITLVVLLCATLLLGGCAAGAPSIVAPVAPDSSSQGVVPAVEAAQDPGIPQPAAPVVVAPESAAPSAKIQPGAADTTSQVAGAAAETLDPAAPEVLSSSDTAAFAQDVPAPADPVSEPVLTGEDAENDAGAPATTITRPPPPPDPSTGLSTIVEGGTNGRLEVALTFDAGADTGYAAEILDLLRDEGIEATFGMTGVWARANPELVQRMVAEGHQLINHTWDHSSLTGANTQMPPMTPEQVTQQLADTEAVVRDLTGYEMRPYFRPPYGDYDETSLGYLYDDGYSETIWWTCDTRGWAGWGAQQIVDYCTTNIAEDEILLLHVGAAAVGDFEALPGLIEFFRDNGYSFVTIEQMLQP